MNPSERSSHPSTAQAEALVDFMERNPSLAKGFSRTPSARDRARNQWEQLAQKLNSMGGTVKTWKQCTKYWSDKKSAVKKKAALRAAARRRTGGGMEDVPEITYLEERIISLLGGEGFSTGDRQLGIQAFDESQLGDSHEISQEAIGLDTAVILMETSQTTASSAEPGTAGRDFSSMPQSRESHAPLPIDTSQTTAHSPVPGTSGIPQSRPSARDSGASLSIETVAHRKRPPSVSETSQVRRVSSPSRQHTPPRETPTHPVSPPSVLRSPPHPTTPRRRRRLPQTQSSPPSQRRTQFASLTDRFLRVEEQRLELDRRNAQRNAERDRMLVEAVATVGEGMKAVGEGMKAVGEGLKMLADALKKQ